MPRKTDSQTGTKSKLRRAKSLLSEKLSPTRKTAAKSTATKTKTKGATLDLTDQIAAKAYELYEKRGYNHGLDKLDWDFADKLVNLQLERKDLKSKKRLELNLEDELIQQKVAQKAYELYEQTGCQEGSEEYNWYIAQEIIRLESK